MAAKPSGLSLGGFSPEGKLKPPKGVLADVAGFGENKAEAPESPKMFLVGKDETEPPKGVFGFASGDVCMESAMGAPVVFVAVGCPKRPLPTELPVFWFAFWFAFWGAPKENAG